MWQVGIVPAGRSEVMQRLWHQKESFSSFFFFFLLGDVLCGPLENATLPFGVAQ